MLTAYATEGNDCWYMRLYGICHDQYKDMPYDIPLYVAYESYATYNMPLCIAIYTPYRVHITRWHVSHALGSC